MTDLQKAKLLFDSFDIGYTVEVNEHDAGSRMVFEAKEHKNVSGYNYFVAVLDFNPEGKSLGMGVWE